MPRQAYTAPMPLTMIAAKDDDGRRLDRILRKALPYLPLSAIHRMLRQDIVLVNDKPAAGARRILEGEVILVKDITNTPSIPGRPCEIKFGTRFPEILYEGEGLLFLNKPSGLSVHGKNSLEDLVHVYLEPKLPPSLSFKPGPLHRLDKPSSGLITFSTNIDGARGFSVLMRERKIKKQYLAIVEGLIEKTEFWRDELVRDGIQKKTFTPENAETEGSKSAITRVKPLMKNRDLTLILAEIETGRTHQIRAQAAARRHPLLGDKKYGGVAKRGGFFLHAWRLEIPTIPHLIEAPLPENFQNKIRELFGQEFIPAKIAE